METRTRRELLSPGVTVLVAAVAWTAACVFTGQMPLATRLAVGLTGAAVLLIVAAKATTTSRER